MSILDKIDIEVLSVLRVLCEGNPSVTGLSNKRLVMQSFHDIFVVSLNKLLKKNSQVAIDFEYHDTHVKYH